ncbi:hypothetical protein N8K70_14685 [Microbacterium betulae]|uniref:Fibronectin type-III domain-containing protein n=1 Tax=Microbacterium betulae TaxID=2981139 RepID=A0AA97I6H3_9MICO|nr:hypothetical protein [Microbacterium sp. AB]WOF22622.1 hypothetical protein N8K70_14685 [Microbacterium sp. AB]
MIRRRALAVVAALATLAVLAGSGTAAAAWNASAALSATASSATIGTALVQDGQLNTTYRYTGSVSTAATGSLTITNSGGAPLSYELANQLTGSAALAEKTALILWVGTCGATIPSTGTVTTTLADRAPALPEEARALDPGASVTVCVATRISGTNAALQGESITAAFSVTGAVGTSWTTTASTDAITQSVYRIAAATDVACAASGSRAVTLRWTAPSNRPAGAAVRYRVYDTATGGDVVSLDSSSATVSVTIDSSTISRDGSYTLAVEAKDTASGTTAPASATISVVRSSILFGWIGSVKCS